MSLVLNKNFARELASTPNMTYGEDFTVNQAGWGKPNYRKNRLWKCTSCLYFWLGHRKPLLENHAPLTCPKCKKKTHIIPVIRIRKNGVSMLIRDTSRHGSKRGRIKHGETHG